MIKYKKIEHKVNTLCDEGDSLDTSCKKLIEQVVKKTLQCEAVDDLCVVAVLLTDDDTIREYNRDYREIDQSTDVLAFPMQTFTRAGWIGIKDKEYDDATGELPLGDIIMSFETVKRQATEYENTIEYETAYLITHSTLHLIGYYHDNEKNEKTMHEKTKIVMREMGFILNDK